MKKNLRELLESQDFEGITGMARERRRVLGSLTSLMFDADSLIGWRAVEATGKAAAGIAEDDPDVVREHLRRLNWLLSEESGGICWRAPEAMAEIVRHEPELFAEYIPMVVSYILNMADEDLEHFRAGILWAIGRLGDVVGEHLPAVLPAITSALDDSNPQARGMAVWCMGQIRREDLLADRSDLLSDQGSVDLYEDGLLKRVTVGDLARRVLDSGTVEG